ncbi:glycosyltransferase [Phormidium sp. LEGE 05292]|uniref:glycosyltransferase family 2 protein n=1 Tax=[Phormidium] sp. LEGE 05292 TaxID=767427 RepID=UPI00187FCE97|nr:glycosyltransferase [Phormidium sp. LEGE 05292]MBE9224342.1 glycosyltransferase [Phormidium sp. LEGE 05292]
MKDNCLVSIAINNYNYGRFINQAIDSSLNQSYPNVEVIVVDDGSTDNSREIIASYGDKIVPVFKENGGQASAFNAGFAASRGEIICFLDADDVCLPQKAVEVVKAFGDRTDLEWCFHPLKWVDGEAKPSIERGFSYPPAGEYDLREHIKAGKLRDKLPVLPSTSGLCFRRSLLQKILPMPEAKRIGLNDGYLEFTAIALSKGLLLDRELTLYRVHGSNAYSMRKDNRLVAARILTLTAYWMRVKYPFLSKFTNNIFAAALGAFWHSGGVEPEYQEFVKKYFSFLTPREKIEINARAIYNRLKP